jgi:outer membrane protein assembly factor BamD (BamD/ComL family)
VKKIIILLAVTCLSGCATWGIFTDSARDFHDAGVSVKEHKFPAAVKAYNKVATDSPQSALAAEALFELALVHAHPDNPGQDYAKATQTFVQFIKRFPEHKKTAQARIWISALKTIQELQKQIEQLKRIDIRHEERRRK